MTNAYATTQALEQLIARNMGERLVPGSPHWVATIRTMYESYMRLGPATCFILLGWNKKELDQLEVEYTRLFKEGAC